MKFPPKPKNIRVSPAIPDGAEGRVIRIANKDLGPSDEYHHAVEKGEVVLRVTRSGKQVLKATFYETTRGITVLNIQRFSASGNPHNNYVSLVGDEIGDLVDFIEDIQYLPIKGSKYQAIPQTEIDAAREKDARLQEYLESNPELAINILRHQITTEDVVALGYRKRQLEVFKRLLNEPEYFKAIKERRGFTSDEAVWQAFFEKNKWIFGYGLQYVFTAELLEKKLEQVLQGSDLYGAGKRPDGVMKTRGLVNFLCLVEIKTPQTELLANREYRPGCWAPSSELSGAVAQLQHSLRAAMENTSLRPRHPDGSPTGEEIFQFAPSSFVIIGSLAQFRTEQGVHEAKAKAFELYRANLAQPEILTYDELYERAKFIVRADDEAHQQPGTADEAEAGD